jgi:hypothetical protein
MGYKAWNNYDDAERERIRALPWHQRYNWLNIGSLALVAAVAAALWYILH